MHTINKRQENQGLDDADGASYFSSIFSVVSFSNGYTLGTSQGYTFWVVVAECGQSFVDNYICLTIKKLEHFLHWRI